MTYRLDKITLRLRNDEESLAKINEIFADIVLGKIPLVYTSENEFIDGIAPISEYSNYESDETGEFDYSICAVTNVFFTQLENDVSEGLFKEYVFKADDVVTCAQKAWQQVWEDQRNNKIDRSFVKDYESTVPRELTNDGTAHCYLYIGVK